MSATFKEPSNSELLRAIKKNAKAIEENRIAIGGNSKKIDVNTMTTRGNSKKIDSNSSEISSLKGEIALMRLEFNQRFEVLEERTALIPKLYNLVDNFVKNTEEGRQERTMLFTKSERNEKRISKLESRVFT
jgi:hypothetical protein